MFLDKMLKFVVFVLIIAVSVGSAGKSNDAASKSTKFSVFKHNMDPRIKQNFKKSTNDLLLDQINYELNASYIYRAYASFFQRADVNLPGIHKFFSKASDEEKEHAQKLIDYVNKRGGQVLFSNVGLNDACKAVKKFNVKNYADTTPETLMCICGFVSSRQNTEGCPTTARSEWKSGLQAFEDALATELFVNDALLKLHQAVENANDPHLAHLLEHEFLSEQVDAIDQLGHFITRLKSFKGESYSLGEYMFDQKLS